MLNSNSNKSVTQTLPECRALVTAASAIVDDIELAVSIRINLTYELTCLMETKPEECEIIAAFFHRVQDNVRG